MKRSRVIVFLGILLLMGISGCASLDPVFMQKMDKITNQMERMAANEELILHQLFLADHPGANPAFGAKFMEKIFLAGKKDYDKMASSERWKLGLLFLRSKMFYNARHTFSAENWQLIQEDMKITFNLPVMKVHWNNGHKYWHPKEFRKFVEKIMKQGLPKNIRIKIKRMREKRKEERSKQLNKILKMLKRLRGD